MLTQIKEEPIDYDEMDMCNMQSDNDVDDDDDDDDDDAEEPDDSDDDEDNFEDDDEDEDIDDDGNIAFRAKSSGTTRDNEEPSDVSVAHDWLCIFKINNILRTNRINIRLLVPSISIKCSANWRI